MKFKYHLTIMSILWILPLIFGAVILFGYHVLNIPAFGGVGTRFFSYCVLLALIATGYFLRVLWEYAKLSQDDQRVYRGRLRFFF
ncbi:MAG TPA: hypothetical protein VLX68_13020 [Chitinivibrionales bacterium]|nr:hypothetical protein [Chitinivibrionales bacterium]